MTMACVMILKFQVAQMGPPATSTMALLKMTGRVNTHRVQVAQISVPATMIPVPLTTMARVIISAAGYLDAQTQMPVILILKPRWTMVHVIFQVAWGARMKQLAIMMQARQSKTAAVNIQKADTIVAEGALPTKTKTASAMRLKLRAARTVQRATTIQMLQMTTVLVCTLL